VALVILAGCGGGGGGDDTPDAPVVVEQCTPGAAFELGGRSGVLGILNVHVNASGIVEADATAELLLLMDSVQTGTDVAVTATLCDIQIPEIPLDGQPEPVSFEATPALIASVPPVMNIATLSGDTTCATFTTDRITLILGAVLDPPETALLPEADDNGLFTQCGGALMGCDLAIGANCVCDQENDGLPGATLVAMNTPVVMLDEVYVDLRTSFTLIGEVHSSDLIIGEVADPTLEQGILACLKENGETCFDYEVNAVKMINPVVTQLQDTPSTFRSVRVDAALDCAGLVEMRDTLFPR
jgi:hypothetical protein